MLHPSLRGARACIFDAGGTLVHPDWPRLAAFAETAARRVLAPEEMRRAMGDVLKAVGEEMQKNPSTPADERKRHWVFRRMYLALGVEESACEQVVEQLDAAHLERHLWCGLDPDAPRVLEELRREGLRVAVISNTEDGRLRDSLEAARIADLFDLLVDSHLVGCRKPDEAIFRLALDELGVEAGEAAFVGDSYAHDALAARAAGLRAILLDPLDLHPESVCPRIRGLSDLIRGGV
ncbi:MAG TPA: HAD-IA family hydrolase [Pyrinomonadaceae bacterium]|nr:HAD-IA family hydrolase [Pyrinomonadaceae bacterium]